MAKQNRESTTRDPHLDNAIEVCIKAFQGALETTTTSVNKCLDEITMRYANDMYELKISHAQQVMAQETKFKLALEEMRTSLEYTQHKWMI